MLAQSDDGVAPTSARPCQVIFAAAPAGVDDGRPVRALMASVRLPAVYRRVLQVAAGVSGLPATRASADLALVGPQAAR